MKKILFVLLMLPCFAWAQQPVSIISGGAPIGPGNPLPTGASSSAAAVTGFGTLSATNASTLLSTLTTGPNSAVWPTVPGMVYVINASNSAGIVYACPLGGTCVAATGIPIAPGGWYGFYKPATAMTVIAATTASVSAQW